MKISASKTKNRLIVKEIQTTETLNGRIVIPDIEGTLTNLYEVVSVGRECSYEVGDRVFTKKVFVSPTSYKGLELGSVNDAEILGHLEEDEV